jgi:hypothetical protein
MGAEDDGSVIGYMCRTDWECEMGLASEGNSVFPSVDSLKQHRRCVDDCGIVEVAVSFRKLIEAGSDNEDNANE